MFLNLHHIIPSRLSLSLSLSLSVPSSLCPFVLSLDSFLCLLSSCVVFFIPTFRLSLPLQLSSYFGLFYNVQFNAASFISYFILFLCSIYYFSQFPQILYSIYSSSCTSLSIFPLLLHFFVRFSTVALPTLPTSLSN